MWRLNLVASNRNFTGTSMVEVGKNIEDFFQPSKMLNIFQLSCNFRKPKCSAFFTICTNYRWNLQAISEMIIHGYTIRRQSFTYYFVIHMYLSCKWVNQVAVHTTFTTWHIFFFKYNFKSSLYEIWYINIKQCLWEIYTLTYT